MRSQFANAFFDPLFQLIVRPLKPLLRGLPLSQVCVNCNRSALLTVLVMENGRRDQDGDPAAVLRPQAALKAEMAPPRLRISRMISFAPASPP